MSVDSGQELLDLARSVEAEGAGPDADRLASRLDSISGSLDALCAAGAYSDVLDLVGCLSSFWQRLGMVERGRGVTEHALRSVPAGLESLELARATLTLGELAFRQGDQRTALDATTRARDIAQTLGDGWTHGRAELNLARIAFRDGDAPRISEHAGRVLALAAEHPRLRTAGTHMQAWAEYTAGNTGTALTLFEENAASYRAAGNAAGEASELANIATLALEAGDVDRAAERLRDVFGVPAATESAYLLPALVGLVGTLAGLRGDAASSVRLMAASQCLYDRSGLTPDPGGASSSRVFDEAKSAVGAGDAQALVSQAEAMAVPDIIGVARDVLALSSSPSGQQVVDPHEDGGA